MNTEATLRSLRVELNHNLTSRAVSLAPAPRLDIRAVRLSRAIMALQERVERYCQHDWRPSGKVWAQCQECGAWKVQEHD